MKQPREHKPSTAVSEDLTLSDERKRQLLSSMFLRGNSPDGSTRATNEMQTSNNEPTSNNNNLSSDAVTSGESSVSPPKTLSSSQLDGILSQVDAHVPHDPIALRQTVLYKGTLGLLQYQRDNYLMGTEHADRRSKERQQQQKQQHSNSVSAATTAAAASTTVTVPSIYSAAAAAAPTMLRRFRSVENLPWSNTTTVTTALPPPLGHGHVINLASDFIPSVTVQRALTPLLTGLVASPDGSLYQVVRSATTDAIHEQQMNLEQTIKNQLLQFLDNPHNRDAMKSSTQGMLIQGTAMPEPKVAATSTSSSTTNTTPTTSNA